MNELINKVSKENLKTILGQFARTSKNLDKRELMAKEKKKKPPKERADKYAEKVKFDGTLEEMIQIGINNPVPKDNTNK